VKKTKTNDGTRSVIGQSAGRGQVIRK